MSIAGELIGSASGVVFANQHALRDGDVLNVTLNGHFQSSLRSEVFAMNTSAVLKYQVLPDQDCEFKILVESSAADATAHILFDEQSYTVSASGNHDSRTSSMFNRQFEVPPFMPQLCSHRMAPGQTRRPVYRPSKAPAAAPTLKLSAHPTASTSTGK